MPRLRVIADPAEEAARDLLDAYGVSREGVERGRARLAPLFGTQQRKSRKPTLSRAIKEARDAGLRLDPTSLRLAHSFDHLIGQRE